MRQLIRQFLKTEGAGGFVLIAAALLALLAANIKTTAELYQKFLHASFHFGFWSFGFESSLSETVNNGLMTLFFLLVGLEIKREFLQGELTNRQSVSLPFVCAIGGILFPALFYLVVNHNHPETIHGWAIPTATDTAFALGVLALLGKRIPHSLRVFLLALAIIDDIGAILVISLFYTNHLNFTALAFGLIPLGILLALNRQPVKHLWPYLMCGGLLWIFTLQSGLHATLSGIILAMTIPLTHPEGLRQSILLRLEKQLHPWVALGVLPIFSFTNAGLVLQGLSFETLEHPLPLGIVLGLVAGKQLGVFSAAWLCIKTKFSTLPVESTWPQFYGVCFLTGIGFTMSLFIGDLAFFDSDMTMYVRLGVLSGSIISALLGYTVLRLVRNTSAA